MRRLILLRHAKAEARSEGPDWLRPLRPSGIEDATAAGQVLAGYTIDLACVSAAKRADQTWQAACRGGAQATTVELVDWLYGASAAQLLRRVEDLPSDVSTALYVGHEPGMSSIAWMLAAPGEPLEAIADRLPTASILVLEHKGEWGDMCGLAKVAKYVFVRA